MSEMVENQDTKWYVLRVVSGKEKKVKEYLDKEIRLSGWSAIILQVFCPVEKIFKEVGGKKALREKIQYPGYLMLEASGGKLKDDIIQTIKNITGVIHFLGKENPIALRKQEVSKMFGKLDEVSENGIGFSEPFIVGETVKIIDGPFNEFNGCCVRRCASLKGHNLFAAHICCRRSSGWNWERSSSEFKWRIVAIATHHPRAIYSHASKSFIKCSPLTSCR